MKAIKLIVGIILSLFVILLFYSFPYNILIFSVSKVNFILIGLGFIVYGLLHLLKKPEGFYIWNHEFSHLIMSKIFFKKMKGFHITERRGGRVELTGTNFLIDLSPYFFYPMLFILVFLAFLIDKANLFKVTPVYFLILGFFICMMCSFTLESFFLGQEDIKRNGILFSLSLIIIMNILLIPLYFLPGIMGKQVFLHKVSIGWWKNLHLNLVHLWSFLLKLGGLIKH